MNDKKVKDRLIGIDVARGIAMLFIIIGHGAGIPAMVRHIIFSFHVPLFFIISGFTYKYKNKNIVKDMKRLIIPYCITVFAVIFFSFINGEVIYYTSYRSMIISALHGWGSSNENVQLMGAIWFLVAMFFARRLINSIFSCFENKVLRFITVIAIMFIGVRLSYYKWLPLNIDIAFVAVGFIYIGILLRENVKWRQKDMLIGCFIIWIASLFCGEFSMSRRSYEPWYILCLGAVCASMLILNFCLTVKHTSIFSKTLGFIGTHTILLLCIHDLDWRLPFSIFEWGNKFNGTWLLFPLSVINRTVFDLGIMCMVLLLSYIIKKKIVKGQ